MTQPATGAETITDPGAGQPAGETPKTVEELTASIDAMKKTLEEQEAKFKAEKQGLDRSYTTVKNQFETFKKEKMTEEERKAAELAETTQRTTAELAEYKERARISDVKDALVSEGLSPNFAKLINASDPAEIRAAVTEMKAEIKRQADADYAALVAKNFGGKAPEMGQAPKEATMKRSDFYNMTPDKQSEFVKSKGKIIDD